jgi:transmembrane sensor
MPPETNDERARREAAAWLARLRGPEADSDRADFAAWHAADPANAATYARISRRYQTIWGHIEDTPTGQTRFLPGTNVGRAQRTRYALAGAAAALLVVAGIVGIPGLLPDAAKAETVRYRTRVGEIRSIALQNGSRITLDTQSRILVTFDKAGRHVQLEQGRARFTIAANDPRPFTIAADGLALTNSAQPGTFDILHTATGAQVAVLKGSAQLTRATASTTTGPEILKSGEAATSGIVGQEFGAPSLDWPSGMLVFRDTPVTAAIAEANRYAQEPIRLIGDGGQLRVTATIRAADTAAFARSLASAFGLELADKGREIVLTQKRVPVAAQ